MRIGEVELEHDGFSWSTRVKFPEFAALFGKKGKDFELSLSADEDEEPTEAQRAGLLWFLAHRKQVAAAVQKAIEDAYPEQRRRFGNDVEMPPAVEFGQLRLHGVTFHQATRGDAPYLGFGFSCTWEGEHGFGLMMHGTRCVEAGGGDTAILGWIADRDAKAGGGRTTSENRAPVKKKVATKKPAAKKLAAKKITRKKTRA